MVCGIVYTVNHLPLSPFGLKLRPRRPDKELANGAEKIGNQSRIGVMNA
jgi:hypothetical protein